MHEILVDFLLNLEGLNLWTMASVRSRIMARIRSRTMAMVRARAMARVWPKTIAG